jgi:hypothetical protein
VAGIFVSMLSVRLNTMLEELAMMSVIYFTLGFNAVVLFYVGALAYFLTHKP